MKLFEKSILFGICFLGLLSACTSNTNNPSSNFNGSENVTVPTLSPTPTPEPIVNINVCLNSIPQTVEEALNNQFIRAALFGTSPNSFSDVTGLTLIEFPSPKNNSLYQKLVTVNLGDMVESDTGQIVELTHGTRIKPAGCTSTDCTILFEGESIDMAQIVATFAISEKLIWEDGVPVTLADSIFAYQWEQENTPSRITDETQSYSINENGLVEWVGIPGLFSQRVLDYFRTPLPQHQWDGRNISGITIEDLYSFGPFLIKQSNSEGILLGKNYQSQIEGTKINQITLQEISTIGENVQQLIISGECDIGEKNLSNNYLVSDMLAGENSENYKLVSGNGNSWVSLYFGIIPSSYEESYSMWGGDRADFFGNFEMRQYVSQCLQHDFAQTLYGEHGVSFKGLFPENHPDSITQENTESVKINFDESLLLNTWPLNTDGIRFSQGNINIFDGTLIELTLIFPESPIMHQTAQLISNQLSDCGITVSLVAESSEELFKTGAEGIVFGRNFDLALVPWQSSLYSVCELLSADAIPGEFLAKYPYGWGGWNPTGWQSEEFDIACDQGNNSFLASEQFSSANQIAQTILEKEAPIIPLFVEPSIWVIANNICGVEVNTLTSEIISLENIDILSEENQSCP